MSNLLDKPETRALVGTWYLEGVQPREIEERLREQGLEIKSDTLRQWLTRRGFTKKRKAVEAQLDLELSPAKVAQQRLERAKDSLDRWATKSESVVDKALDAANKSTRLRDLSVAAGAAAQGLRIYQICAGIGTSTSSPAVHVNFDFGFARGPGSPFSPEAMARARRQTQDPGPL
jgi:hypothetical protein